MWVILELAKMGGYSIKHLQNNIKSYRSGGSGNIISRPILPIKITPELESIIIHLFCDGQAGDHTPSYYQKNEIGRSIFIQKLKNCFGDFKETVNPKKLQIRFPKAITDVLTHYYRIESYLSKKAKIPSKILSNSNKSHLLACLTAFIVDEGYIRDIISGCSVNKVFISQMRGVAINCGYLCNPLRFETQAGAYVFSVSNKSLMMLRDDIFNLSKKYPTCDFQFKQDRFSHLCKQSSMKPERNYELVDSNIIKILKRRPRTTSQIATATFYSHGMINQHLRVLHKKEMVSKNISGRIFNWSVK